MAEAFALMGGAVAAEAAPIAFGAAAASEAAATYALWEAAAASAVPIAGEGAASFAGLGALPQAATLSPYNFGAFGADAFTQIPAAVWPEAAPSILGAEPAWGATQLAADAIPGYGGIPSIDPSQSWATPSYDFGTATNAFSGPTSGFPEPISPGSMTPGQLIEVPPVTSTTDPAALDKIKLELAKENFKNRIPYKLPGFDDIPTVRGVDAFWTGLDTAPSAVNTPVAPDVVPGPSTMHGLTPDTGPGAPIEEASSFKERFNDFTATEPGLYSRVPTTVEPPGISSGAEPLPRLVRKVYISPELVASPPTTEAGKITGTPAGPPPKPPATGGLPTAKEAARPPPPNFPRAAPTSTTTVAGQAVSKQAPLMQSRGLLSGVGEGLPRQLAEYLMKQEARRIITEKHRERNMGRNQYARGGLASIPSRYIKGSGSGRDDTVKAVIDGKRPARLSSGEYVIDAEAVAMLGDGSSEEGARRLDDFRKSLRKHKGANLARGGISPDARTPAEYMRGGGRPVEKYFDGDFIPWDEMAGGADFASAPMPDFGAGAGLDMFGPDFNFETSGSGGALNPEHAEWMKWYERAGVPSSSRGLEGMTQVAAAPAITATDAARGPFPSLDNDGKPVVGPATKGLDPMNPLSGKVPSTGVNLPGTAAPSPGWFGSAADYITKNPLKSAGIGALGIGALAALMASKPSGVPVKGPQTLADKSKGQREPLGKPAGTPAAGYAGGDWRRFRDPWAPMMAARGGYLPRYADGGPIASGVGLGMGANMGPYQSGAPMPLMGSMGPPTMAPMPMPSPQTQWPGGMGQMPPAPNGQRSARMQDYVDSAIGGILTGRLRA